ncbi:hypothetical protein H1S01_02025 [Heliobacterium chlorum]|uniref:RND related barrel-sandwich hybrid domain-containing protein n=1 Tax=Heliobacterium chlorum TaxID=2698 RepID=A0ABR7SXV5_HELCL|nr:HlyD family efflux transporter periplasmic adaptor subunit [Heliobacterium chlorum]MBC9783286.1 hypothetical protein [Heliobacterium chlorum]
MSRLTMVPVGKEALKKRRRLAFLRLSALFAVLLLAGLGGWWLKDKITGMFVKVVVEVQPAKMGQLSETRPLPGWVIRDEFIVNAPLSGRVQRLVNDGERARVGAPVVKIKELNPSGSEMGSLQDVFSPRAGLISYRMDGLEEVLNSRVLDELNPEQLATLREKPWEVNPDSVVQKGTPLFKVVDNLEKAYFLIHYNVKDLGGPLVPTRRVTLAINAAGPNFYGKVLNVRGGDDVWALIQLSNPPMDVLKARTIPLLLVDKVHKGVLLPKSALVERNGEQGVWVSVKNRAEWRNVNLVYAVGEQVIVEGLDEGLLVIQNPTLLKEGQEIK